MFTIFAGHFKKWQKNKSFLLKELRVRIALRLFPQSCIEPITTFQVRLSFFWSIAKPMIKIFFNSSLSEIKRKRKSTVYIAFAPKIFRRKFNSDETQCRCSASPPNLFWRKCFPDIVENPRHGSISGYKFYKFIEKSQRRFIQSEKTHLFDG